MCPGVIDLTSLLIEATDEPNFITNGVHFARGHDSKCSDNITKCNSQVVCYKIIDDKLIKLNQEENGIFSYEETYLIKWKVCNKYNFEGNKDDLYFYWKGSKASKGYSPLPPEIEEDTPVERICQWSEPTVFLRLFSGKMIVHSGKKEQLKMHPRLYILCGEFYEEMRFYEVPCRKDSLRSKACFLLTDVGINRVTIWYGSESLDIQKKHISKIANELPQNKLITFSKDAVSIETIEEGKETEYFLNIVKGSSHDYFWFRDITLMERTPRLFYFHKLTGTLDFIEIQNIYRSNKCITQFPFLQSHLFSVAKPALFMLDASYKVWIWTTSNPGDQEDTDESFDSDFQTVKCLGSEYSKKMNYTSKVKVILAGNEPCEFTNLFPYWEIHNL